MQILMTRILAGATLVLSFGAVGDASAAEFLTEKELLSTIPGATLTGISNDDLETTWVQTYEYGDRKGTSSGFFGGRPYISDWRVGRGLWCETWVSNSGGGDTGCWRIEMIDQNTLQPWHGTRKLPNVWKIVQRNPAKSED